MLDCLCQICLSLSQVRLVITIYWLQLKILHYTNNEKKPISIKIFQTFVKNGKEVLYENETKK